MKYVLSWGVGVNSTAIIAMQLLGILTYPKEDLHIIFADTGTETPSVYPYVGEVGSKLINMGYIVKQLKPKKNPELYTPVISREGLWTLDHYYRHYKAIPVRMNRSCTMHYKVEPINKYQKSLGSETTKILGIGADEQHRARDLGNPRVHYPLIDHNIDRAKCMDLIKAAGLPPAQKSGCYLCPFQRKAQWIELYHKHPDLFAEVEELEKIKQAHRGRSDIWILDKPIRQKVEWWIEKERLKQKAECDQLDLFDNYRHCMCEL